MLKESTERMMTVKLTDSQKKAVETINKNIAVNAGAGSGKTGVLVERYIYLLENGNMPFGREVESILAITFTNKAAAEMKERVRKSISEKANEDKKWTRIYRDMEKSNISTIHSLCLKILRENPVEGKIDPKFTLLETYKSNKMLKEVIEDLIIKDIEKNDEMLELMRYFTPSSMDKLNNNLVDNIKKVYEDIRSTGLTFEEVKECTLRNIDSIDVDISLLEDIKNMFGYLISKARANSKLGKLTNDEIWLDFVDNKYSEIDSNVLETLKYLSGQIGSLKGEEETLERLEGLIDNVLMMEEKNIRHIYEGFLNLLIDVDKKYTERKIEISSLDYEDLQINALKLLEKEDIRNKYQDMFRYIMVDEFQDTNGLQKRIIYNLCSKNSDLDRQNLFIVGDPKQSIYGFRGADVNVFYEVMKDIETVSGTEAITLKDNFRTIKSVMGFINSLFNKLMADDYTALISDKESKNDIDVEILEQDDLKLPEDVSPSEYAKLYESEMIAKRIKKLVIDEGYSYKDIAILFRSTTDADIYEEGLKKYNILFYNVGGRGFYTRQEILDIINGLKAINNRYDDLSVVGVLRSPMFGLSDKTIYWIMRNYEDNMLDTLNQTIPNITDREQQKIKRAYYVLDRLNKTKFTLEIHELIKKLLTETYYIQTWILRFGNKQAIANIYKFIEIARQYSKDESKGLDQFLTFIDEQIEDDSSEEQAQIQSESGDTVKLMTIHKSKGLQFSVVIIPQLAKQFNFNTNGILFDKSIGIGIKHVDFLGNYDNNTSVFYNRINEREKQKEIEENKRILYVAMTRAKEKLILGSQSAGILRSSFKKLIDEYLDGDKYTKIGDIDIEKEHYKEIVKISGIDVEGTVYKKAVVPLLKDYEAFGKKYFSRYTITQYMMFNECKRKFYMSYYKRIPVNELFLEKEYTGTGEKNIIDPLIMGQMVHNICERYKKNIDIDTLIDNIIKSFGLSATKELIDQLKLYTNNYAKFYKDDFDKAYAEREFYYKVSNRYMYGIIDRINIIGDKAEIIDFKTNKVGNRKYFIEKYAPQIRLYASAVKDIYDIEIQRAGLLMLYTGEFIDIDISEDKLKENMEDMRRFISFVESNKSVGNYDKGEGDCKYCQFNSLCDIDII